METLRLLHSFLLVFLYLRQLQCLHVLISFWFFKFRSFCFLLVIRLKSLSFFPSLSVCLWSNKEMRLEAKYFPLRVFKHSGSLLPFRSVAPSDFLWFTLPVVVCCGCKGTSRAQLTQTGRAYGRV